MCGLLSLLTQAWRFESMSADDHKGLSRRSQLLLWLLQHQPEVIQIDLEYETGLNDEELLDLSEDEELAEALLKDLLSTENDAELEANRDFLETAFNKPPAVSETNRESEDGDRAA